MIRCSTSQYISLHRLSKCHLWIEMMESSLTFWTSSLDQYLHSGQGLFLWGYQHFTIDTVISGSDSLRAFFQHTALGVQCSNPRQVRCALQSQRLPSSPQCPPNRWQILEAPFCCNSLLLTTESRQNPRGAFQLSRSCSALLLWFVPWEISSYPQ